MATVVPIRRTFMPKVTSTVEHEVMAQAVSTAREVVERAATLRRAHELSQSAGRAKLTARAWRRGLLILAAHDEDEVVRLDDALKTRGHLYTNTAGYIHETAKMVGTHWWAPGSSAPMTPMADRRAAEIELASLGLNVFTACLVAVNLAESTRAEAAFGPVDNADDWTRERDAVRARADAALQAVATIPAPLLTGLAVSVGVHLDPIASLPERLTIHVMHGSPAPEARRLQTPGSVASLQW